MAGVGDTGLAANDAHMKYAAFISYAHADEKIAARLHRALETFALPKDLRGEGKGRLKPIFRDAAELSAHHSLSEKIQMAVKGSRFLIVLCSPAAKASHWVNEEIRLFRQQHGENAILCALVEGDPSTAFPPALLESGREPLAANLSASTFRLGTTQLAAAMLGVGLDDLVQRDARRRARRMQLGLVASLAFSGLMGLAAFLAVDARNEAEAQRNEAEGLIEFMITELKDKLAPLGKLELLDDVGDQAVEYYDAQDASELTDESLLRQAHARFVIAEVALDMKDTEKAKQEIKIAAQLIQQVRERNPNDADAIYADAQSAFWLGKLHYDDREFEKAKLYYTEYRDLSLHLYQADPKNIKRIMEVGYGENGVGSIARRQGDAPLANRQSFMAIDYYDKVLEVEPDNYKALLAKANALAGAARVVDLSSWEKSRENRRLQIESYEQILKTKPEDYPVRRRLVLAKMAFNLEFTDTETQPYEIDAVKTMKSLLEHDPINSRWQRDLLRLSYGDTAVAFYNSDANAFYAAERKFNEAADIYFKNTTAFNFYDLLLPKLIATKKAALENDSVVLQATISDLKQVVSSKNINTVDEGNALYQYICLMISLEEKAAYKEASKTYLALPWVSNKNTAPRYLFAKQHLLTLVGESLEASKVAVKLKESEYPPFHSKPCNG